MVNNKLFDQTTRFIQRALDLLTVRQKVISNNISNSESPNYSGKEIPFQKILSRSISEWSSVPLQKTHAYHLEAGNEMTITPQPLTGRVELDHEMAKLAENQLIFQSAIQALLKKLEALRLAIQEGGR